MRLMEFIQVYRLYRRAGHPIRVAARIASDIAFKGTPF